MGHRQIAEIGQAWTCECGRAGMNPRTPGGRGLTFEGHLQDVIKALESEVGRLTDNVSEAGALADAWSKDAGTPWRGVNIAPLINAALGRAPATPRV